MGSFWHKKTSRAIKRVVFICKVQGAMLTGMESYVARKIDTDAFDKVLAGMLSSGRW